MGIRAAAWPTTNRSPQRRIPRPRSRRWPRARHRSRRRGGAGSPEPPCSRSATLAAPHGSASGWAWRRCCWRSASACSRCRGTRARTRAANAARRHRGHRRRSPAGHRLHQIARHRSGGLRHRRDRGCRGGARADELPRSRARPRPPGRHPDNGWTTPRCAAAAPCEDLALLRVEGLEERQRDPARPSGRTFSRAIRWSRSATGERVRREVAHVHGRRDLVGEHAAEDPGARPAALHEPRADGCRARPGKLRWPTRGGRRTARGHQHHPLHGQRRPARQRPGLRDRSRHRARRAVRLP